MKNYNAADVEAYITSCPAETRSKLKELRKTIKSAVPESEESISWGMPFFRYHGILVGIAAHKNHVSIWSVRPLRDEHRSRLEKKGYVVANKTLRIDLDQKVPVIEIRRIVKEIAESNRSKDLK